MFDCVRLVTSGSSYLEYLPNICAFKSSSGSAGGIFCAFHHNIATNIAHDHQQSDIMDCIVYHIRG